MRKRTASPTRNQGFSLLEILFALLILGILGAGVLKLLMGNRQRLELTANLFTAMQVANKMDQDVWEEAQVNGTLLELTREFPELVGENEITEAQSPYFRHVFDRKAPFGLIQPAIDQGIAQEDGVLFEQLQPFAGKVEIERLAQPLDPGYEKHLARATIRVFWQEKDGMKRTYTLPVLIPSPVGPLPLDPLPVDDAGMKPAIRDFLFPGNSSRTLEQVVMEKGCDLSLAEDVGRIAVFSDVVGKALATITLEISQLRAEQARFSTPSCVGVVKPQFTICRRLEKGASLAFHFLAELAPIVNRVAEAPPEKLTKIGTTPVVDSLTRYQTLTGDFLQRLKKIRVAMDWLATPAFHALLSHRDQQWVREKSLEITRLLRSLGEVTDTEFRAFLTREKAKVQDRNPFLAKMYLRNELLLGDAGTFRQAFPNQVSICDRIDREIKPAASAAALLAQQLASSTAGQ